MGNAVGLIRDISDRKRAEADLQRVNAELEKRVEARTADLASTNASLQKEIAERARAEEGTRQVNRMLRVLSECNQAIVRLVDEPELLRKVCYILGEFGGYPIAWVGLTEEGNDSALLPASHYGIESPWTGPIPLDETSAEKNTPELWGRLSERASPASVTPSPRIPRYCPGTMPPPATAASDISLFRSPWTAPGSSAYWVSRRPTGEAFGHAEVDLLRELAADLGYAIGTLRARAEYRGHAGNGGDTERPQGTPARGRSALPRSSSLSPTR